MTPRRPFEIGATSVPAGKRAKLEMPIARLMSGTPVALPVLVLHGKQDGPAIWLSAAVHGDEVSGVEIIRRVVSDLDPRSMKGTVVAVPVVNVHGFNTGDRYLPDRRDLNRSFPGSERGSLAARVAHLLMTEVVSRCSIGIDLHTGSDHRTNLPQIRADLDDPETLTLTRAFAPPIAIQSRLRDGSLRQAASESGATVLLFEGGESLRFDSATIVAGASGVRRVIAHLGIAGSAEPPEGKMLLSRRSSWMRASKSGLLHLEASLGDRVEEGQQLATIFDPFGQRLARLRTRHGGLVIGHTQHPLVNQGDAIAHVAELD
jgi:hypothetical protein